MFEEWTCRFPSILCFILQGFFHLCCIASRCFDCPIGMSTLHPTLKKPTLSLTSHTMFTLRQSIPLRLPKHAQKRTLITACTSLNLSLSTALSTSFDTCYEKHSPADPPSHLVCLISREYFPLSSNIDLYAFVRAHTSAAIEDLVIGVVDRVPHMKGNGGQGVGVSMMMASKGERGRVGVKRMEEDLGISVGRWRNQRLAKMLAKDADIAGADAGAGFGMADGGGAAEQKGEEEVDVDAGVVFALGDPAWSRGEYLQKRFPNATKIGILPTPTHFFTGNPQTLYHNHNLITSGGLTLSFPRRRSSLQVEHPTLKTIGNEVEVEKALGNMIIHVSPTRTSAITHILLHIRGRKFTTTETNFFARLHRGQGEEREMTPLVRISAGDPSRDSVSLENEWKVDAGDKFQLLIEEGEGGGNFLASTTHEEGKVMIVAGALGVENQLEENTGSEELVVEGIFGGMSEKGFIIGKEGTDERNWICTAKNSVMNVVL
ncbi:hypothetical protein SAICODRAFT_126580 [Saitoella complicata NRRL Y-17804]|uniref:uncharacterized protein n=1 Tax=Saitoella complicata (strain BCRC 22490 / CBS 7301 / JCM 7358 / NBRC 10748 / NRRL Y-17804) TaxID=698492 RepID=UPI0008682487|nr:uncharacterized protein SAICODRAFT_126580 [Saitoella complicata NRRL Y-17804]ODQ52732.1 hypothetical protein SAICODRAFT_126580 [Saitoella complicata NRRL Y-17804]